MRQFKSLSDLVSNLSSLDWYSAIFVDIERWDTNPLDVEIFVLEGDDELDDLEDVYTHYPKLASKLGIDRLLDTETFRDVVGFQLRRDAKSSTEDLLYAINYYREYDDFYDPEHCG